MHTLKPESRTQARCSEPTREARRALTAASAAATPLPDALFRRLAGCLEVESLEKAILESLRAGLPRLTALIRIGTGPSAPRVYGPKASTFRRVTEPFPGLLAAPLEEDGETLGFLGYLQDEALEPVRAAAEERLVQLADLALVPAKNALRHRQALDLAYRDALTGLYNRRAFLDDLEREAQRAGRHGRPLVLILLDMDGLKQINDTFGHAAGDLAIRALARVMARSVRREDIAARLGGDEFAILCPDTDIAAARRIGTRIQRALAQEVLPCGDGVVTVHQRVSFGVAQFEITDAAEGMMRRADADLYASKRGRQGPPHLFRRTGAAPDGAPQGPAAS